VWILVEIGDETSSPRSAAAAQRAAERFCNSIPAVRFSTQLDDASA
jgi:hypothetical protein